MADLSEVLAELTPDRLVEIWRATWGVGGPHNKGPIDMGRLETLSRDLRALPSDAPPAQAAGLALHAITHGRPFWDCNKRTGWSVCFTIMSAMGYGLALTDEKVEEVVLAVENGHLTVVQTADAVAKLFRDYRAKRR